MTITQLRYFLEVSKTKNMTQAAINLYVSQSTLSKSIKELEKELDVSLFNRTHKTLSLTYYGEIFLPLATHLIKEMDDLIPSFKKHAGLTISSFTINTYYPNLLTLPLNALNTTSLIDSDQPALMALSPELQDHERLKIISVFKNTNDTINDLLRRLISVAIISTNESCIISHPLIEIQDLGDDDLYLLTPQSYTIPPLEMDFRDLDFSNIAIIGGESYQAMWLKDIVTHLKITDSFGLSMTSFQYQSMVDYSNKAFFLSSYFYKKIKYHPAFDHQKFSFTRLTNDICHRKVYMLYLKESEKRYAPYLESLKTIYHLND